MQDYRLTIDKFLDHAAKWSRHGRVVEAEAGRSVRSCSYAELRTRANLLSGALLSLGASPGHRIGTLAWNSLPHLELYYAAMGAGLVCHTLNPRMTAEQLAEIIEEANDRIVAVSSDLLSLLLEVAGQCQTIEHIILLDGDEGAEPTRHGAKHWRLEGLIAEHGREVAWGAFDEQSPAGLCYTSGTTGRPKGVVYTHRANYLHTLRSLQADAMAFTAEDTILVAVPMFHANGWGLPFAAPAVGASLVLPGRHTDGASLARLMADEQVTVAVGIHTLWLAVADHLEITGEELPQLERVIIGGSPCPENLINRIEQALGVTVQTSWGMTELSPLGTIMPLGSHRPALSSGRLPIGVDLKLVDADGVPLPIESGEVGHLRVKGASVVERYFGDADSALDHDGYFDTGDLATVGVDGDLTIRGRSKDLIKSGGEWINPAEIEAAVSDDPGVDLVAVIGTPDDKWTERPLLVVQAHDGAELDVSGLVEVLRKKIASWWIPDRIALLPAMPLTGSGKIDKVKLRADYAAGKIESMPISR